MTITVGTTSTTVLVGMTISGAPAASDVATISQSMYDDAYFSATTTALTANSAASSAVLSSVSAFTNINIGNYIVGTGIQAGTIVLSTATASSQLTMSNPASATQTASPFVTVPPGRDFSGISGGITTITIPNRGTLKLFAGDVIAVDTQTGWPIVLSKAAAAATTAWVHT